MRGGVFCACDYNFNPRSPRGERQASGLQRYKKSHFFTPPSPGGERLISPGRRCGTSDFNPRSPRGERRLWVLPYQITRPYFNPRSPRGERRGSEFHKIILSYFNPRSPRGERRVSRGCCVTVSVEFQPTLPSRGATIIRYIRHSGGSISTHAPLAGSDYQDFYGFAKKSKFQPTLPSRGATGETKGGYCAVHLIFQPTLPSRGATHCQAPHAANP